MRPNPTHAIDDPEVVRELIRANPWATIVSGGDGGMVASHYPVLLDEGADGLVLLTHVGRPDDELHSFGEREVLVIVQGRNGYISPSWYGPEGIKAPTWNFTSAHLYGVPEVLGAEENLATLARLVEHFERRVEEPMYLDQEWGREIAKGTVGLRIPVARFDCKRKLSADKDDRSRRQAIAALRELGPYHHPELAEEMERVWESELAAAEGGEGVTDDAQIVVTDAPERQRFEATVADELAGFLVYRAKEGLLALIHTEVEGRFEGQGVGGRLARFALDQARAGGLSVLPFCPFVNEWMKRHREYVDLVPASYRANFDL